MLGPQIMTSRKNAFAYQESLCPILSNICKPLEHLNLQRFSYGKFYLDHQQNCSKTFLISNHLLSQKWYCFQAEDHGTVFSKAVCRTGFDEKTYFLWPEQTRDTFLCSYRELLDLKTGVSIYKRHPKYIETWGFARSQDSPLILTTQFQEALNEFIVYFHKKITEFSVGEEISTIFLKAMDFGYIPPFPETDLTTFYQNINVHLPFLENRNLSARERQCAELFAQGYTSKMIGEQLRITPRTAEWHLDNVKQKTGLRYKTDFVQFRCYRETI